MYFVYYDCYSVKVGEFLILMELPKVMNFDILFLLMWRYHCYSFRYEGYGYMVILLNG